jgi:hypothetical protein
MGTRHLYWIITGPLICGVATSLPPLYIFVSAWRVEALPKLASSGVGRVPIRTTPKKNLVLIIYSYSL